MLAGLLLTIQQPPGSGKLAASGSSVASWGGASKAASSWASSGIASVAWTGASKAASAWTVAAGATMAWTSAARFSAVWGASGVSAPAWSGASTFKAAWNAAGIGAANWAGKSNAAGVWSTSGLGAASWLAASSTGVWGASGVATAAWAGAAIGGETPAGGGGTIVHSYSGKRWRDLIAELVEARRAARLAAKTKPPRAAAVLLQAASAVTGIIEEIESRDDDADFAAIRNLADRIARSVEAAAGASRLTAVLKHTRATQELMARAIVQIRRGREDEEDIEWLALM